MNYLESEGSTSLDGGMIALTTAPYETGEYRFGSPPGNRSGKDLGRNPSVVSPVSKGGVVPLSWRSVCIRISTYNSTLVGSNLEKPESNRSFSCKSLPFTQCDKNREGLLWEPIGLHSIATTIILLLSAFTRTETETNNSTVSVFGVFTQSNLVAEASSVTFYLGP